MWMTNVNVDSHRSWYISLLRVVGIPTMNLYDQT